MDFQLHAACFGFGFGFGLYFIIALHINFIDTVLLRHVTGGVCNHCSCYSYEVIKYWMGIPMAHFTP